MLDSFVQFIRSLQRTEVLVELVIIWSCVFLVFRFLRGTRGAGAVRGLAILIGITLLLGVIGQVSDHFARLNYIYTTFIGLLAILLIVVFQPELRQAMIRIGHARFFRGPAGDIEPVVDAVTEAVELLSKSQFGALIAIERMVKLGGLVEGGQVLDAKLSARLLQSIFWPNSPLHDLGVVVRGGRIVAANVQFPLIEEGSVSHRFGSRHRAALGLSVESDAVVVIVSEETGGVSIAEQGQLEEDIPREQFREILAERLGASSTPTPTEPASEEQGERAAA